MPQQVDLLQDQHPTVEYQFKSRLLYILSSSTLRYLEKQWKMPQELGPIPPTWDGSFGLARALILSGKNPTQILSLLEINFKRELSNLQNQRILASQGIPTEGCFAPCLKPRNFSLTRYDVPFASVQSLLALQYHAK